MSTRWRVIVWAMGGGLWAALLAGCAMGPTDDASRGSGVMRAPAEPLLRRGFTTPGGREWDFILGSDYSQR